MVGEDHQKITLIKAHFLHLLANSFNKGIFTKNEEWHISAKLEAQFAKCVVVKLKIPECI